MESDSPGVYLWLILIVATAVFAFASVAEGAIGSLSRARVQRLADQNEQAAKRIVEFAERPAKYLATLAVVKPAALIAAVIASIQLLDRIPPGSSTLVVWISAFVVALLLGWVAPHAAATDHPENVASALAFPIRVLSFVVGPLARVVSWTTDRLSWLLGAGPAPEGPLVTPAELKVMVAASEEEGLIERQERTMIDNVLELEEKTVREVMVPRPDIVALPTATSVRGAVDTFVREGYSRLPVYRDTIDDIVGILYGKDLLPLSMSGRLDDRVGDFVRPAYFVPESKKAGDLLRELQQLRVHIAIVVDEYGGTAGMVTIEDALEEIVGEIQDEFDTEEQKIVKVDDGEALVDGGVSIDDVNEELGLDLSAEEVDTIGGLVHERLGRIPVVGDRVEMDSALLTVVSSSGRRVTRVRVKKRLNDSPNGSGGANGVRAARGPE